MSSGQKDIRRRMSEAHEAYIASIMGGVRSPGSGNQAANPSDGRQDHHTASIAFSWDCKATVGKSITFKLSDWDKILQQSEGERPMIPLRMYLNDRLTECVDVLVVHPNDFVELLDENRRQKREIEDLEARIVRLEDEVAMVSCYIPEGTYISI